MMVMKQIHLQIGRSADYFNTNVWLMTHSTATRAIQREANLRLKGPFSKCWGQIIPIRIGRPYEIYNPELVLASACL